MTKQVTITIEDEAFSGLTHAAGGRPLDSYIRELLEPHFRRAELEAGYRAMAEDTGREAEAKEWLAGLSGDIGNEAG
ncbi:MULTISPECIES: addiction module antitoxin [unclassified Rhizobium]|uniref:addiction module antitoxin n=1 Tax=unclassified Rhizobium TaxID=2613769 RepID=UPI00160228A7|nr:MULTISPECIES: addiction module antitoxin [unclassified Rhizobium]MBB1250657.1 addiction module antitoxin [Rhizobium sp. G21]MDH6267914.1 putative CopG family antitoxin [Rhizobium sp. SG_E_25_P2]